MRKFFKKVDIHVSKKILDFPNLKKEDKEYWSKLIVGYSQLKGLKNGYNYEVLKRGQKNKILEIEDFLIIQSDGEIPELLSKNIFNKGYFRYARKKLEPLNKEKLKLGNPNYFKKVI